MKSFSFVDEIVWIQQEEHLLINCTQIQLKALSFTNIGTRHVRSSINSNTDICFFQMAVLCKCSRTLSSHSL
ncbi:hypothetical protein RchiOBHm_Chr1g0382171 [Rosa chinensis]|uniref:Uncharacterized protein n=1 Tax=Rosa chinensis TaxID=74649 RepID=A0A2P6SPA4_ROSCH|nr:hypothetical protein RchiOBHm_Chr1g0382171 [Rosa chinensis]